MPILKALDLEDSDFMFDSLPNSKNGKFGKFGRPAEPSAPAGGRFGRPWRDSRFHLRNSENEAKWLRCYSNGVSTNLLPSTRLVFVFFNKKPHFRQDESETCRFEECCL